VIHERADRSTLALLRVWIFGIWFVQLLFDPLQQLSALPDDLFRPPGFLKVVPTSLWSRILEERSLMAFRVILLGLLLLVALGTFRRPYVPILTAALVAAYQGIVRGYSGHMNHAEIMLLWATMLIVFFPMSDVLSVRRPRDGGPDVDRQARAGVLALAILFAASYFFVAAVRIFKGIDLFRTDALRNNLAGHWVETGRLVDGVYRLPSGTPLWDSVPASVLQLLFVGVTVLELVVPLVIVSKWARWLITPGLLLFHILNIVLLGIPFFEDMLMLVLFSNVWFAAVGRRLAASEVRFRSPRSVARAPETTSLTTQRA
jgi:hypothetical protein